ncbi:hypothetical protein [Cellulophaga sp. L1A9]|uniref:hypothetical protein n=1 Tax=Cellulophaga sp. L1A9 TaxID=2686362 RepID=UPI00131AAA8D|nr:hypothetical protein [Cellulophaga sp. L1A9]
MKSKLKWILGGIFMLVIAIAVFFPMGLQDRNDSGITTTIEKAPRIVYLNLNDIKKVEKWLKTKDTPVIYETYFSIESDTIPSIERADSLTVNTTQKITRTYSSTQQGDTRIKIINYTIKEANHGYTSGVLCTLWPRENGVFTAFSLDYYIDYKDASFIEKTIGKWKIILAGEDWKNKETDLLQRQFVESL